MKVEWYQRTTTITHQAAAPARRSSPHIVSQLINLFPGFRVVHGSSIYQEDREDSCVYRAASLLCVLNAIQMRHDVVCRD